MPGLAARPSDRVNLNPSGQTSTTWRPLYVPQTAHTAWGSLGDRHWGQATVATGVAFHWDRRDRVLLRDILRLGTATSGLLLRIDMDVLQGGPALVDLPVAVIRR